jgi:hypothetical protein
MGTVVDSINWLRSLVPEVYHLAGKGLQVILTTWNAV